MQQRNDDAEAVAAEAEQLAGADLRAGILWRGVRAETAARRGEFELALSLAHAAVDMASVTDALLPLADARLALAAVLRLSGDIAEADAERNRAIAVCEAKGATVLVDLVRAGPRSRDAEPLEAAAADTEREPTYANNSFRVMVESIRAVNRGDFDAVVATLAPGLQIDDRRQFIHESLDAPANVELLVAGGGHVTFELLATRGERLNVSRLTWTLEGATVELLGLSGLNPDGLQEISIWFDADDIDVAHAELDRLFIEHEGAPHAHILQQRLGFLEAMNRGDWPATRAFLSDDWTLADHRPSGFPPMNLEELEQHRDTIRFAGNRRMQRVQHVLAISGKALLTVDVEVGWVARDGGRFEQPMVSVIPHDGELVTGLELFGEDQLEQARTRFDELSSGIPDFKNRVMRAVDDVALAWNRGDWDGVVRGFGGEATLKDDRRFSQLGEVEALKQLRMIWDTTDTIMIRAPKFFTRGDGMALYTLTYRVKAGHSGPSDMPILGLVQYDASGELQPGAMYDVDDLENAYAELNRRYLDDLEEGERSVVASLFAAFDTIGSRDIDAIEAVMAPEFEEREQWLAFWREVGENVPDLSMLLTHVLGVSGSCVLGAWEMTGTYRGVEYERVGITVFEMTPEGQLRRADIFELSQLDDARARFDEC